MRFLFETIVVIVCAFTALFLYQQYWDNLKYALFGDEPLYSIYVGSTAVEVSVADDHEERTLGLSGKASLRELEGKLFIFDTDAKHGIWMKDMFFPIDIIWFSKDLEVVHTVENVSPDSYPEVFVSPIDARFVLEMNAFIVSSLKIRAGDRLTLPPTLLPEDIKKGLQQ